MFRVPRLRVSTLSWREGGGGGGEPYGATVTVVPGSIEAEEFDLGGEGVGYSDADAINIPGVSVLVGR